MANRFGDPSQGALPVSPVLASGGRVAVFWLVVLAILVFEIAAYWKVFVKAGRPGWAALIPIYNIYVLVKIAGRPGWWVILYFIPIVSLVIAIIIGVDVARNFGRGSGFGVGLALLAPIFFPILGFGSSTYVGHRGGVEPAGSITGGSGVGVQFCPQCGARVSPGSTFCASCGHQLPPG
jgi:hypothetical protein